jgi:hypothetical protein
LEEFLAFELFFPAFVEEFSSLFFFLGFDFFGDFLNFITLISGRFC